MDMSTDCKTLPRLALFDSKVYLSALILSCIIAFPTFPLVYIASRKLLSQSIVRSSTRVFLFVIMFFGSLHQLCYIIIKLKTAFKIFMNYVDPCDSYEYMYDCRFIFSGMIMGNSGLTLIQSAVLVDRILSTFMGCSYGKMGAVPGIVMSVVVVILSSFVYPLIILDDPLNEYVPTCGYYPPKSSARFTNFFRLCLLLSIIHAGLGSIVIKAHHRRQSKKRYDVEKRYQHVEALICTQSVFLLSVSQFIFSGLYCAVMMILFEIQKVLSTLTHVTIATVVYVPIYDCLVSPLLIILMLNYVKNARLRRIHMMTNTIETQQEHMDKLRIMWS